MILCYLACPLSPVGAETHQGNIQRAKDIYRQLCLENPSRAFIAPWILNCEVFDETPEFREIGMLRNDAWIKVCSELWLCGPRISSGMHQESLTATRHGVLIVDCTGTT